MIAALGGSACRGAGGGGLAVSFDVEARPPEPPQPAPAIEVQPPLEMAALTAAGPYQPGEKAEVSVRGRPGMKVAVRMGENGPRTSLTEDSGSPGQYHGSVNLTGVAPGRYPLIVEAESADGTIRLDGPAALEVVASRALARLQPLIQRLQPVYFETNRWDLTETGRKAVEELARVLHEAGAVRATVEGHADEQGGDQYNYVLGVWRAKTVKDVLRSLGVDPSRLTLLSHGKKKPAVQGSEREALARNRRVEIVLRPGS